MRAHELVYEKPFQELLGQVDRALDGSGISRVSVRQLPYRLRLTFTDGPRTTEVDFTHDRLSRCLECIAVVVAMTVAAPSPLGSS